MHTTMHISHSDLQHELKVFLRFTQSVVLLSASPLDDKTTLISLSFNNNFQVGGWWDWYLCCRFGVPPASEMLCNEGCHVLDLLAMAGGVPDDDVLGRCLSCFNA